MFISYIYFSFTVSVYNGFLKLITYVPIISFFQDFCGIMVNKFTTKEFIIIEFLGIVFLGVFYKLGYILFSKNIAVDA